MKVLVTGGTGLVGKNLQSLVHNIKTCEFTFLSSKHLDLTNRRQTIEYLKKTDFHTVVHLAANVGGLFKNQNNQLTMFVDNIDINTNILLGSVQSSSIKRVIMILSTCIFPDEYSDNINEQLLHKGPPHSSNRGYAYAKRMGAVMADIINSIQTTTNIQLITPTNLYGIYDNFDLENSHVIPSLIRKCVDAKRNNSILTVRGTGIPLRQFLYVSDLCIIIKDTILYNIQYNHMIVAPLQEYSIKTIVYKISDIVELDHNLIRFTDKKEEDGQVRKFAKSNVFDDIFPNFKFTDIDLGLRYAIKSYQSLNRK